MKCTTCNVDKEPTDFYTGKTHNGNRCKKCKIADARRWIDSHPFKKVYRSFHMAKRRAKQKGFEFDISLEDVKLMWSEQDGKCALSNLPFGTDRAMNASLDRIDAKKGYIVGNVRFILFALNTALADHGIDIYLEIAKAVLGNRRE